MDNPEMRDNHNPDDERTIASRPTMPLDESTLDDLPPSLRSTDPRESSSGGLTFGLIAAALVIIAVVAAIVFFTSRDSDEEEAEVSTTSEPISVPVLAMTPIYERIATLENDESVSPEEIQAIRDEIAKLDEDNITVDEVNNIINQMDSQFVDSGELREELDTLLGSDDFSQSVLGVIDEANQQATQTQAAVECVIKTLPAYPSVRVHVAPSTTAQTRDFIVSDREYKVIGRTNGELNTDNLWWLIEIDVRNQVNGWISSDLVEESSDENCMNIVVMPVGN